MKTSGSSGSMNPNLQFNMLLKCLVGTMRFEKSQHLCPWPLPFSYVPWGNNLIHCIDLPLILV